MLTITNEIGCQAKDSMLIFVYKPVSSISVSDYTICTGIPINLAATDYTVHGSTLSNDLDFGNNNSSSAPNPSTSYNSVGNYTVNLIFTEISTACKDSITKIIYVQDYPIAGFSSTADSTLFICPNDNVIFTDTSFTTSPSTTYSWDFGNGSTSTFTNPGTAYLNNGTYTVQLITGIP